MSISTNRSSHSEPAEALLIFQETWFLWLLPKTDTSSRYPRKNVPIKLTSEFCGSLKLGLSKMENWEIILIQNICYWIEDPLLSSMMPVITHLLGIWPMFGFSLPALSQGMTPKVQKFIQLFVGDFEK